MRTSHKQRGPLFRFTDHHPARLNPLQMTPEVAAEGIEESFGNGLTKRKQTLKRTEKETKKKGNSPGNNAEMTGK